MAAYNLISTTTVGSGGVATVSFGSIPQTYTDLLMVTSMRTSNASVADYAAVSFNSLTTSFSQRTLAGTGIAAATSIYSTSPDSRIAGQAVGNNATANVFSNGNFYIPNYTSSTNKSFSYDAARENNATGTELAFGAVLWSNTAAITSIEITSWAGATILQYSSFSLYGIKNS
jgi:hypothetical protein